MPRSSKTDLDGTKQNYTHKPNNSLGGGGVPTIPLLLKHYIILQFNTRFRKKKGYVLERKSLKLQFSVPLSKPKSQTTDIK